MRKQDNSSKKNANTTVNQKKRHKQNMENNDILLLEDHRDTPVESSDDSDCPPDFDPLFVESESDHCNCESIDLYSRGLTLYEKIQSLSPTSAQRVICNNIETLRRHCVQDATSKKKKKTDYTSMLYPGQTLFTKSQPYRYLAWNTFGTILKVKGVPASSSANATEKPLTRESTIEIHSLVAGLGQRRQVVDNATTKYNIGAVGLNGYALARHPGKSDLCKENITCQSTNGDDNRDDSEANDTRTASDEGESVDDSESSVLVYHPFTTWGPISKAWWSKTFNFPETITHVAVGNSFIAVLTSLRYLRIFSCSGLSLYTSYINGDGVALLAEDHVLLLVSQLPLQNGSQTFTVEVLEPGSFVHHCETHFNLPNTRYLVWAGFTSQYSPILVDDLGSVFALLPAWKRNKNSDNALRWFPIADLKSCLEPYDAAELMDNGKNCGLSILSFLWIASCTGQQLNYYRLSDSFPQPPRSSFELLSCHFCLPIVFDSSSLRLQSSDWTSYLEADPDLKDLNRITELPWECFNELYSRTCLMEMQADWVSNKHPSQSELSKIQKTMQKISAINDKALFRLFLKALGHGRVERCLETAALFRNPKALHIALTQAESRGCKSLCERLQCEVERRVIKKNTKELHQGLRICETTNATNMSSINEMTVSKTESCTGSVSLAEQLRLDTKTH